MQKKNKQHGGRRPGSGRRKLGRRGLTVRIKTRVLEALSPNPARKIRDLIESRYAALGDDPQRPGNVTEK
jgi:hypothetical protein